MNRRSTGQPSGPSGDRKATSSVITVLPSRSSKRWSWANDRNAPAVITSRKYTGRSNTVTLAVNRWRTPRCLACQVALVLICRRGVPKKHLKSVRRRLMTVRGQSPSIWREAGPVNTPRVALEGRKLHA